MDLIEVVLLNFRFKFRRLFWKEEFGLQSKQPKDRDSRRVVLAAALVEVSGLKIKNFDEAWRLLSPEVLPTPIMHRVFLIYKGKQPETRLFATQNLYKAPEPSAYGQRLDDEVAATDKKADVVIQRMEQQFDKKELNEAAEIDRQILAGAADSKNPNKYRGAVRKDVDEEDRSPLGAFKVRPNA
jgi:hypothetical protein